MTIEEIEKRIWLLVIFDEKLQEEKVGYIKDAIINMAERIQEAKNRCKDH